MNFLVDNTSYILSQLVAGEFSALSLTPLEKPLGSSLGPPLKGVPGHPTEGHSWAPHCRCLTWYPLSEVTHSGEYDDTRTPVSTLSASSMLGLVLGNPPNLRGETTWHAQAPARNQRV